MLAYPMNLRNTAMGISTAYAMDPMNSSESEDDPTLSSERAKSFAKLLDSTAVTHSQVRAFIDLPCA